MKTNTKNSRGKLCAVTLLNQKIPVRQRPHAHSLLYVDTKQHQREPLEEAKDSDPKNNTIIIFIIMILSLGLFSFPTVFESIPRTPPQSVDQTKRQIQSPRAPSKGAIKPSPPADVREL